MHQQHKNIADMIFGITVCCTKLSILLLILRIFISSRRDLFFWAVHFLIWINITYWIMWFFLLIFLCLPRTKIWNPKTPGHCLGKFALYRSSAVFNMITDIMMLAVPLYKIFHLQMSMKRKIGISAVFATGFLSVYPGESPSSRINPVQSLYLQHHPSRIRCQLLPLRRHNIQPASRNLMGVSSPITHLPTYQPQPLFCIH